jgi:hypothetical protein
MQIVCFSGFSARLALFTGRNERRHAHHGHPTSYGATIMSKSKIVIIAALAGMGIASSAFAQTRDDTGSVLPYHYEHGKEVWGSWYAQDPAGNRRRESTPRSPSGVDER